MDDFSLDDQVARWRTAITAHRAISSDDADELEGHLRERIDALEAAGLAPDEAFLIGVKRIGAVDDLSREFALEHSDRLWKHLLEPRTTSTGRRTILTAAGFAALAALLAKVPALLDSDAGAQAFGGGLVSVSNAVALVLAALGGYFAVTRRAPIAAWASAALAGAVLVAAVNLYPFSPDGMTLPLAVAHAPVALWLLAGIVFAAGPWRSTATRMDFIRFTGEWFVYYVLIALGGAVLIGLTIGLFAAIDVDATRVAQEWILPCGAAGAVIVAAWLVDAKQAVIENIAPVLTRAFTPLFTALMIALIAVGLLQGGLDTVDRNLLILFDVTLLVVLGLLLYSMSARDPLAPAGWFDRLQVVLLVSALTVDLIVLIAMLARIGEYGFSANKTASLGLNLILLGNLVGAAALQTRFALGRIPFATVERWQTAYLPVYLAWAAVVVLMFPPLFAYA